MTSRLELRRADQRLFPTAGSPRRSPLAALGRLLLLWQGRANSRARLAMADDRDLRDMGLTRAQAAQEVAKPFWRA